MSKVIPSLSELGWVKDTGNMLSKLLSYYMLTDAGQTISFQNNLTSLPATYFRHLENPDSMAAEMRSDLTKLLERHFDNVEVLSKAKTDEGKLTTIMLYAHVLDEKGKRVSMGRVLEMDTGGLRKTVDINNIGEGAAYFGD